MLWIALATLVVATLAFLASLVGVATWFEDRRRPEVTTILGLGQGELIPGPFTKYRMSSYPEPVSPFGGVYVHNASRLPLLVVRATLTGGNVVTLLSPNEPLTLPAKATARLYFSQSLLQKLKGATFAVEYVNAIMTYTLDPCALVASTDH